MLQSDPDTVLAVVGGLALLLLIGVIVELWVGGWFKRDSDDKWEGKL